MVVLALLAVLGLLLAAVAAALAVLALRRLEAGRRPEVGHELPEDVLGLRQEVAALRAEAAGSLRHLAVVRYDAFEDLGGRLSWSVALLDDGGDGVVLTSIRSRSEARTYAKGVSGWTSEQELSPEEREAVAQARP